MAFEERKREKKLDFVLALLLKSVWTVGGGQKQGQCIPIDTNTSFTRPPAAAGVSIQSGYIINRNFSFYLCVCAKLIAILALQVIMLILFSSKKRNKQQWRPELKPTCCCY